MLNLFQEINNLPGVRGVLANIRDTGILSAGLEKEFPPLVLNEFEIFLEKQRQLAGCDMEIRFKEAVILIRRIDDDNTLAVIGTADLNLGLLNVTLDMLQEELQKAAARAGQSAPQNLSANDDGMAAKQTAPADSYPELADMNLSGALQNMVMALRQALLETIGPLAGTIMSDSVRSWAGVGPATAERLEELIDLLCMEIGDGELENKFRRLAAITTKSREYTGHPQDVPTAGKTRKIMVNKEMSRKLAAIMTDYTTIMGPVGSLIMKDYLQEWAASGEASAERLPELLKMLGGEISDQEKRREFMGKWGAEDR